MILTLDVGNSQIFGGVFEDGELTLRFRRAAQPSLSSDELGLFLRRVLRENGSDPLRRCCTNRPWPARCPPTGSSLADAI